MSLTVDYLLKWSLTLIKKSQSGGLPDTEFAYHWNDSQSAYMDDLLGRFQARNNGKEGGNTGLIENETIITKLTPFIRPATIIPAAGIAAKPADLVYTLAVRIGNYKVFNIPHDKISSVLQDVIDPPSISTNTYYYTEYQGYYSLLPATVTANVLLDYIAQPTDIFWNFTLDANNRRVYSSAGSVHPLWDSNSCREITKRMLKTLGVSFKDQDFASFGQTVLNSGE